MNNEERQARIAQLKEMRAASMFAGKPMYGYQRRVQEIDKEIARLEEENAG